MLHPWQSCADDAMPLPRCSTAGKNSVAFGSAPASHLDKLTFDSPLPFSIGAVVAPDVGGIARVTLEQGEVLGTVSVGHSSLRHHSSSADETLRVLVPQKPNALLRACNCSCDIPHVDIIATELIAEGAEVVGSDCASTNVDGFLLLFDGSCRRDEYVGGAGYCIFALSLVSWFLCKDAVLLWALAAIMWKLKQRQLCQVSQGCWTSLIRPPEQPRFWASFCGCQIHESSNTCKQPQSKLRSCCRCVR